MGGFIGSPLATPQLTHFCIFYWSSMSTGLNSMSAVFLEDFYKPYVESRPSKARSNLLIRSVVVIVGVICALCVYIVEKLGSVLQVHCFVNFVTGSFPGIQKSDGWLLVSLLLWLENSIWQFKWQFIHLKFFMAFCQSTITP